MSDPQKAPPESFVSLLGGAKDAIAVARDTVLLLAAYFYFAGFVYQYTIDDAFGESLFANSIAQWQLLFLAYPVFTAHTLSIALYLACGVLALYGARYLEAAFTKMPTVRFLAGAVTPTIIVALVVAAFFLLYGAAAETGTKTAARMRHREYVHFISFALNPAIAPSFPAGLRAANDADRLLLIDESTNMYFVLDQDADPKTGELYAGHTFAIPKSAVISAKIEVIH